MEILTRNVTLFERRHLWAAGRAGCRAPKAAILGCNVEQQPGWWNEWILPLGSDPRDPDSADLRWGLRFVERMRRWCSARAVAMTSACEGHGSEERAWS